MFIQRLEELMSEKNIVSYKQLSREINIPSTTIYSWKSFLPKGENLIALANYFEVSIDYLVGRSDSVGIIKTNANLTEMEISFLTLLRKITPKEQARVFGMLQGYIG